MGGVACAGGHQDFDFHSTGIAPEKACSLSPPCWQESMCTHDGSQDVATEHGRRAGRRGVSVGSCRPTQFDDSQDVGASTQPNGAEAMSVQGAHCALLMDEAATENDTTSDGEPSVATFPTQHDSEHDSVNVISDASDPEELPAEDVHLAPDIVSIELNAEVGQEAAEQDAFSATLIDTIEVAPESDPYLSRLPSPSPLLPATLLHSLETGREEQNGSVAVACSCLNQSSISMQPDGATVSTAVPNVDGRHVAARNSDIDLTDSVRRASGLGRDVPLHPPLWPRSFRRLSNALAHLRSLEASGAYRLGQLGVFAKELSRTGSRVWVVDTNAGFALTSSPLDSEVRDLAPRHFYEILVDGRPCWLYFDIEFSRIANPGADVGAVTEAFRSTLSSFCVERLGAPLDASSLVEMDSTTAEKYSRHVVAKRLQLRVGCDAGSMTGNHSRPRQLAFKNNMQAGWLVGLFVDFARNKRLCNPHSAARLLFMRPERKKKKKKMSHSGASRAAACVELTEQHYPEQQDEEQRDALLSCGEEDEACIVDESVYTRNRCFRVLFSSKFGKKRPLRLVSGISTRASPALQLLESLATHVPDNTPFFTHEKLPADFGTDGSCTRTAQIPKEAQPKSLHHTECKPSSIPAGRDFLFKGLVDVWDQVRRQYEQGPAFSAPPTVIQKCLDMGGDGNMFVVSLTHNRFCMCKGGSHQSNGVYLVVNVNRGTFYQKCHDIDCRGFRSDEISLPSGALSCLKEPGQGSVCQAGNSCIERGCVDGGVSAPIATALPPHDVSSHVLPRNELPVTPTRPRRKSRIIADAGEEMSPPARDTRRHSRVTEQRSCWTPRAKRRRTSHAEPPATIGAELAPS
eukprot:TRINITY_DN56073_c0_g1_i1.p1 TRINITY_DN56073_c0_g1~~TRINITY_DN56073_c0_g1_i1.p1  ORF type:complete len:857 (+),score=139.13 TRINITY_DN56073_c0_g1_i1:85-2655(+)